MSTKEENMALWNAVEKTNPKHTKPAKIGGMNITAIAPQYQILKATEQWGAYAVAWGFKNIELDFSLVEAHKIVVFKGDFFCPNGQCQIINSAKLFMDRAEKMLDADFAKKIETDALTKVLSKMGFNADVFMGRFDDHKYVEQMTADFAPPKQTKAQAIASLAAASTLDELSAAWVEISVDNKKNDDVIGLKDTRKIELTTTK